MSLDDLLQEMENIFDQPLGRLDSRRKFEMRKWNKEESFSEYWHDKIILGNRISIQEDELVDYMVNVYRKAFKKISLAPETTRHGYHTSTRDDTPRRTDRNAASKGQAAPSTKSAVRGTVKCYSWNQVGHYAKDCLTKAKQTSGSEDRAKVLPDRAAKRQVGAIRKGEESESEDSTAEDGPDCSTHPVEEEICAINLDPGCRDDYQKSICCDIKDAFSKFVRLYATKTTNAKEAIKCLDQYFQSYSKPKVIVSDRGSAFTFADFGEFIKTHNIKHVKIATGSPQANGQAKRLNRTILPMLSKLSDKTSGSTGQTPSHLVFGLEQRGPNIDNLRELISTVNPPDTRDVQTLRNRAAETNAKLQRYQKKAFNTKHKAPRLYKPGELVMIRNYETTPGVSKKLVPKFRGPYEIKKTLGNDRYVVCDPPGFQNTQKSYEGVWEAKNIRPWLYSPSDCI
ncbi:hypothetical protein DMN91_008505 [Ooceraea biroi]|uniref:Integrase catalytic domain-containing protein n=2 Tax=Ooceraea biroi TaxID=2015173 RepID=A0A3L8DHZ3_OOCBI|nr:hypothetical protein DMN91_008505 [Ooceraea biroi]